MTERCINLDKHEALAAAEWRRDTPGGRKWALIVVIDSMHPVPMIAQWDPPLRRWITDTGHNSFPQDEVEWHSLPRHDLFGDTTHAMEVYRD